MTTVIAISPHPDDAILSYGGQLAELSVQGDTVIIYTVFAGAPRLPYSPAAVEFHAMWDLSDEPMKPRLDEDRLAMRVLGAFPVYGEFMDAIYRRDERGEWLVQPGGNTDSYLFDDEPGLVAQISEAVGGLIAVNDPRLVITCSATGNHVDHVRTRDATAAALAGTGVAAQFWEDLPYAFRTDQVPALPAGVAFGDTWVRPVSDQAWQAKIRAVECYASQHRMLMHSGRSITDQLGRHAFERGQQLREPRYGERVWDAVFSSTMRMRHPKQGAMYGRVVN